MNSKDTVGQEMLFIDMMSPDGHIRLNTFYLSQLAGPEARIYVSDDLAGFYDDFNTYSLGPKPCGPGRTERMALALRVVEIVRREAPKRLVLLSYDLATFPFVSHALGVLGVQVFCFEHNTAPNTKMRLWLHNLSSKKVTHFVYTPYLQELYQGVGLHAIYVPHPCLSWDITQSDGREWRRIRASTNGCFSRTGFCPSDSVPLAQVEEIAMAESATLFVCKTTRSSDLPNVVTHRYFCDYGGALGQCDFAVIPFASEHKVSGPVFEAIAAGKHVMVLDNVFGRYVKSLFGGRIFFHGDPLPISDGEGDVGITEYNLAIVQMISTSLKGGPGVRTDAFESKKESQESGS